MQVRSCCPAHLRLHQQLGGGACLPFRIVMRAGVGNCVLATRDIRPGETLLVSRDMWRYWICRSMVQVEQPAVWGPNLKSPPKCCNCLARWQGASCPDCHFPVCGDSCARGAAHAQECGVLASLDLDITFTVGEVMQPPDWPGDCGTEL